MRMLVGLAALVMLAGCAGDGDSGPDETSDPTRRATTSTTTTTAGGAPLVSGTSTTAPAPAGGSAATTLPKSSTTTRPAAGKAAAARATPTIVTTQPGRYRYTSTGTFSVGVTGEQRRTGESILTVDPPAGADQHSFRQGDGRSTEQILRFQSDGTYIVMLKLTEQGLTKEFRPATPVLAFPFSAPIGRTWSWRMTSTDGKTTVETSFRIERTEAVPVGAESVPAVVVGASVVTTGDLASRGTQTLWVAEGRRLVVREQSATDGSFGAFPFRSTAEERLLQLAPS